MSLPSINKIAEILGGDVSGAQAMVPGPGHSTEDRSLSIKLDDDAPEGFIVHSFAGDDPIACRDYVRKKLGLPEFGPKKKKSDGGTRPFSPVVAEYVYRLADGTPYLRVQRTEAKGFYQSHWDGKEWIKGKPKGAKIPYRLPELIAAAPTTPIYICEGEKDCDALAAISLLATSNSEGADNGSGGKWTADLNQYFKDRIVYIVPDNDAQGRKHAQHVARNLYPEAKSVQIVELPDLEYKGDVSDYLRSDRAGVRLSMLAKAAPLWEPRDPAGGVAGDEALILELAGLSLLEYARRRKCAADEMGIGVGELDMIVAKVRGAGKGGVDGSGRKKQADILIELSAQADELFHAPDGTGYATIPVDDHRETWPIRSKGFRRWLARGFFTETSSAPNSEALQSALNVIEARAHFDGPQRLVHVRVGAHEGRLYLDLADARWRAVEITSTGWRIIDNPPVRFRRAAGMLPLPEPVHGGKIGELRSFLNVKNGKGDEDVENDKDDKDDNDKGGDKDFVLAVSFILAALRDRGPYPLLDLFGEHGAAKSTFTAVLRKLIDPNSAALRALPREDRDLFIAASNAHLLAFDNVSKMPDWISDTLCRLATGGGFATRQLYSDQDEALFDAMRPIILNGIEDIIGRPDLADRSIFLNLTNIPDDKRKAEAVFWKDFDNAHPRILGALLDGVARGLRELPNTKLDKLPRMADFALWASACEEAFWDAGTFAKAYQLNRDDAVHTVIEADLVATAVQIFDSRAGRS
jgi:hypothetical protein